MASRLRLLLRVLAKVNDLTSKRWFADLLSYYKSAQEADKSDRDVVDDHVTFGGLDDDQREKLVVHGMTFLLKYYREVRDDLYTAFAQDFQDFQQRARDRVQPDAEATVLHNALHARRDGLPDDCIVCTKHDEVAEIYRVAFERTDVIHAKVPATFREALEEERIKSGAPRSKEQQIEELALALKAIVHSGFLPDDSLEDAEERGRTATKRMRERLQKHESTATRP